MAAEELARTGGGMCAVKEGKILHTLALPLAGLMSLKPAEELAEDSAVMKDANRALGLTNMENPLLRIVTLALPVIPDVGYGAGAGDRKTDCASVSGVRRRIYIKKQ